MLTLKKIEIFQYYNGDGDMFTRCATQQEKEIINKDWSLIESLMQDALLIKSGLASEQYKNEFEEKLKYEGVDYSTLNELTDHIRKG